MLLVTSEKLSYQGDVTLCYSQVQTNSVSMVILLHCRKAQLPKADAVGLPCSCQRQCCCRETKWPCWRCWWHRQQPVGVTTAVAESGNPAPAPLLLCNSKSCVYLPCLQHQELQLAPLSATAGVVFTSPVCNSKSCVYLPCLQHQELQLAPLSATAGVVFTSPVCNIKSCN